MKVTPLLLPHDMYSRGPLVCGVCTQAHSTTCTEGFYQAQVEAHLRSTSVEDSDASRKQMMAMLAKQAEWRQRDAGAPGGSGADATLAGVTPEWEHVGPGGVRVDGGGGDSDSDGNDDGGGEAGDGEGLEGDVDPGLLQRLRAMALSGEEIPLEALPPSMLKAFMKAVSEGALSGAIAGTSAGKGWGKGWVGRWGLWHLLRDRQLVSTSWLGDVAFAGCWSLHLLRVRAVPRVLGPPCTVRTWKLTRSSLD
jgi:hypothetical protein